MHLCFSGQASKAGQCAGIMSEEVLLFQTVVVVPELWCIILQVFVCVPRLLTFIGSLVT